VVLPVRPVIQNVVLVQHQQMLLNVLHVLLETSSIQLPVVQLVLVLNIQTLKIVCVLLVILCVLFVQDH